MAARAEELIGQWRARVDDPKLALTPLAKFGWALAAGYVDAAAAGRLWELLGPEAPRIHCPRSAYFVRAAQAMFRQRGINWKTFLGELEELGLRPKRERRKPR